MEIAQDESLSIKADDIANQIIEYAKDSQNQEDLRVRVEFLLRHKVLDKLNIGWASYEHRIGKGPSVINSKSADALYGKVVIEYEPPKTFGDRSNVKTNGYKKAIEQLTKDYIPGLAKHEHDYHRYYGIAIDGFQIGFVKYRETWLEEGPYPINGNTVMKMLQAIRGLQKKSLTAETLTKDLGPESNVSKSFITMLYTKLTKSNSIWGTMLYNEWRRVYQQVCGYTSEKIKGIEKSYNI